VVLEGVIASTLRIFSFSLGLIIAKAFCSLGLKLGACGLFFLNVTPGLTVTVTIDPIEGTTPELIYSEPLIRDFPTRPEAELLLIFPRKIQPSAVGFGVVFLTGFRPRLDVGDFVANWVGFVPRLDVGDFVANWVGFVRD
jgi:hypothetical protein